MDVILSNNSSAIPPDPVAGPLEPAQASQLPHDQCHDARDLTSVFRDTVTAPSRATSPDLTLPLNKSPKVTLYDIPTSERYFWKEAIVQQLALAVFDKYSNQTARPMPKYEILVMALNEIAVRHGYGFFFYLPFKDSQRKALNEEFCPASRLPPPATSNLPNIYFMKRGWTAEARRCFFETGHRTRYLHCDGLLGIPDDDTPLYAIQHVFHSKSTSFLTAPPSLVVLANRSAFYLASTEDWERLINTRPMNRNRSAEGSDLGVRFKMPPVLWKDSPSIELERFTQLIITSTEELYHRIIEECTHARLRPTFTALELRRRIPRPATPDRGFDLGVPLPPINEAEADDGRDSRIAGDLEAHDYSGPKSRRGGYLARGRGDKRGEAVSTRGQGS